MSTQNGSVVRRLQLGRALRELREEAGFSVEVAAPRLEWSSSKLSRIENGQQVIDVHGVRWLLLRHTYVSRVHGDDQGHQSR
jgi:transcriptional regulator with XRE-family HTH domain